MSHFEEILMELMKKTIVAQFDELRDQLSCILVEGPLLKLGSVKGSLLQFSIYCKLWLLKNEFELLLKTLSA